MSKNIQDPGPEYPWLLLALYSEPDPLYSCEVRKKACVNSPKYWWPPRIQYFRISDTDLVSRIRRYSSQGSCFRRYSSQSSCLRRYSSRRAPVSGDTARTAPVSGDTAHTEHLFQKIQFSRSTCFRRYSSHSSCFRRYSSHTPPVSGDTAHTPPVSGDTAGETEEERQGGDGPFDHHQTSNRKRQVNYSINYNN